MKEYWDDNGNLVVELEEEIKRTIMIEKVDGTFYVYLPQDLNGDKVLRINLSIIKNLAPGSIQEAIIAASI